MKKIIRTSTVPVSLETFLHNQLRWLAIYFEVVAVSSPGEALDVVREREGVRTASVPMERRISIVKDLISLFRMIILFTKERPYIVHSMTPKAGLISMLAAWITRVPVRIHTFTGLIFPTERGIKQRVLIWMDRLTCWCATYINPEGNGVKQDLERFHITRKPLHIIANGNVRGVDMDWYARTEEVMKKVALLRKENCFTFCFVGRLVKDKGINELVHAFVRLNKEYSKTRLILVGKQEERLDPLDTETLHLMEINIQIEVVGRQEDIRPFLVASDALVFPSYREGFPNVVLEAGALGLPAIVTDINGCNEIIQSNVNGELIPARDENALYEKMKDWVEHPEKIKQMATNARRLVKERYERTMIWGALLEEYNQLISSSKTK